MQNQRNLMKQFRDNGQKALFWRQKSKYFGYTFFYKNRASSLFYIYWRLTSCKKSEKSNGGKYENFGYWRTDWRCWFHNDSRRVLINQSMTKGFEEIHRNYIQNSTHFVALSHIQMKFVRQSACQMHVVFQLPKNICVFYIVISHILT